MFKELPVYMRVLVVIVFVGSIIGSWAWGLNQIAGIIDKHRITEVRQAEAACAEYGVPHALVTADRAYCYAIVNGSEKMIPLDVLQAYQEQQ